MPTNTDLVTDLPADFAVFGQAVDTSMADLLGGTTGQILAKASATDMDFTWIANDQGDITGVTAGTGITVTSPTGPVPTVSINTAVTADLTTSQTLTNKTLTSPVLTTPSISNINAKGDVLVGTADNTLGVITAGSNGEVLVADSSTSTGLRYQGSAIGKNCVFNSGFDIFQRTSAPTTGITTAGGVAYSLDRWVSWAVTGTGSMNASQQVTGDTTNLPFVRYCARIQRTAANTSTSNLEFAQALENTDSARFIGQTVTFSFYARKGANYSGVSNTLAAIVQTGTGTDQSWWNMTGTAQPISTSTTLTSTWQRFQYTATLSSSATQVGFCFRYAGVGTAGAADYYEVTGVQLELGSIATPYAKMGAGTVQSELAACQRYYWRTVCDGAAFKMLANGVNTAASGAIAIFPISLPVPMRVYPTSFDYANISANKNSTDTRYSTGTWSIANGGTSLSGGNSIVEIFYTHGSSVFTAGSTVSIQTTGATGQYMGVSAELS